MAELGGIDDETLKYWRAGFEACKNDTTGKHDYAVYATAMNWQLLKSIATGCGLPAGTLKAQTDADKAQADAACPQKIKEAFTGKPGDPNYDHLSSVQLVRVFHWPKDNCQHVIAQGHGQDYTYQFLFHCDTLEMTYAQYWKHTVEYAWRTFNHESCIPEGETQPCGGDPCLICKEEALGEVTHKCHVDFSKPECGRQSPLSEVTYSPALLDACFTAATVEIEDDPAPSSTGCCYEFKRFEDGRQESYCFDRSKTIVSQAECPEGSQ